MPQVHLDDVRVKRILSGDKTAIICKIRADEGPIVLGDHITVREPWGVIGDEFVYKADYQGDHTKIQWRPSIFLKSEQARLFLNVEYSKICRISEITEEEVQKLGHQSREAMEREWNIDLKKEERPVLGAKFNPEINYFEFSIDK